MALKRRAAVTVVGIVGGVIGGFIGASLGVLSEFTVVISGLKGLIGAISGLVACRLMAGAAFETMKGKSRYSALFYGPLYGAYAGLIVGFINGIGTFAAPAIVTAPIGAIVGGVIGVVAGFLLSPSLAKAAETDEADN